VRDFCRSDTLAVSQSTVSIQWRCVWYMVIFIIIIIIIIMVVYCELTKRNWRTKTGQESKIRTSTCLYTIVWLQSYARLSSLTVNVQSCLRGRRVYEWEVRSDNMWCRTGWDVIGPLVVVIHLRFRPKLTVCLFLNTQHEILMTTEFY